MEPKEKVIFGVVAGLCAAVILALAAWLFTLVSAKNAAEEARENAAYEINRYYAETPYPSKNNRDIRAKDEITYKEVGDAARKLLEFPLTIPEGESPSQFVTRVASTIHALEARKNATRLEIFDGVAKRDKNNAEATMDYSFGRYIEKGELPKDTDVPRLARQFAVIEHVCDVLLDAGALGITQVTREMFDNAKAQEEDDSSSRRNTRRSSSRRNAKAETKTEVSGVTIPDVLVKDEVTGEVFTISFRATYASVAKVMNALAEDDLFIVVTDLSFKNPLDLRARVAELVKRRENAVAAAARRNRARNGEEEAAAQEPKVAIFENATPAERLVTDPENAMPHEVTLTFEVYSVPPTVEETPAEATAETEE